MTVFAARQGQLLGKEHPGYEAVLGIPYAAPPVGDLRFRPPQEPVPWEGVRDGRIFGAASLQASTEYGPAQGSEDCLFLNVYKPAGLSGSEPLPVMVWLHGGGFVNGSGNAFMGGLLAQTARAVIVTVNYRLGPLGWLALPALAAEAGDGNAGNYGLLDAIAALGWVRDNIAAFGGDPGRVTVFGQSAGGEQVLALLACPLAAGLFHRAISMSAPAGLTLPDLAAAASRSTGFLQRMGCQDSGSQLARLRGASAQSLLNAAAMSWDLIAAGGLAFTPTVGGGVLPGQWLDLFRQGSFCHVPVMIGHTRQEGRLLTAIHENNLGRRITRVDLADRLAGAVVLEQLAQEVAHEYGLDSTDDPGSVLADILTDAMFVAGLEKCRAALARQTTVYSYQTFDPDAPESHVHAQFSPVGAGHDSDLPALWQWDDFTGESPSLTAGQHEYAVQLGRYWGQFAATGDPNGAGLPAWRPFNDGYIQYLETGRTGGTRAVPTANYHEDHKFGFWSPLVHPDPGPPPKGSPPGHGPVPVLAIEHALGVGQGERRPGDGGRQHADRSGIPGAGLGVALAKAVAAAVTGSTAMAAEAAHSLADTGNDLALFIAQRRSSRPADDQHPLGYGREAYFWALIAALGVFVAGAAFALRQGIEELIHPSATSSFEVAYVVLAVSTVFDLVSIRQSAGQMARRARRYDREFLEESRVTSDPSLRAVFVEDAVSIGGDVLAFAALALNQVTGSSIPQGVAAVLIALVIIQVSLRLISRSHDFLVGAWAWAGGGPRGRDVAGVTQPFRPAEEENVRAFLLGYPGVTAIGQLLSTFVGPARGRKAGRVNASEPLMTPRNGQLREMDAGPG